MDNKKKLEEEFIKTENVLHQKDAEKIKTWIDLGNLLVDRYPGQQQQFTQKLRSHLKSVGFLEPAPIQKLVLPYLLKDKTTENFCYIKAPTGTGKTLAFVLPQIFFFEDNYLKNTFTKDQDGKICYLPYALIIVNQHPLLSQIRDDYEAAIPPDLKARGLTVQHFDRGNSENEIKGQILCGVPAKIKELVSKGIINLSQLRYIVVDEADNTIMNCKNNLVTSIVRNLIESGNSGWKMIICGATIDMEGLKKNFLEELGQLEKIRNKEDFFNFKYFNYVISLDNIYHYYRKTVQKDEMDTLLVQIICDVMGSIDGAQIMVLFNEKVECQNITNKLMEDQSLKFLVVQDLICEVRNAVQGQAQVPRHIQQEIIELFRSEKKKLMLCSDLMGRGMNFRKVRLVINYGVPRLSKRGPIDMNRYDQRVGRTGRMEDLGVALTIFNPEFEDCLEPESSFIQQCQEKKIVIDEYSSQKFEAKILEVTEKMIKIQLQNQQS